MNKKYLIAGIICLICAAVFAVLAIGGTALFGPAEPETPPLVQSTPEPGPEPEPEPEPVVSSEPEEPEEPEYQTPIDFAALQEENPDIYGWLEIPGADISYPLLQSAEDDSLYLDHNRNKEPDINGSLFTEHAYNGTDFTDRVTPVYGHNMKSGAMFGKLQKIYTSPEALTSNNEVVVYLPDREIHYTIFAAVPFDTRHLMYSYGFESEDDVELFLSDLAGVRSLSAVYDDSVAVTGSDRLIVLSTCLKGGGNGRFLVVAKEN